MMHVAIDPNERRETGPAKAVSAKPASGKPVKAVETRPGRGRIVGLAVLGCGALAGLSVAAYSALGSIAGPQVVRPNLYQMQKDQAAARAKAADWPDLRDGVPALASEAGDAPIRTTGVDATKAELPKVEAVLPVVAAEKALAAEQPVAVEKPVSLAAVNPVQAAPAPVAAPQNAMPQIEPVSVAPAPKAVSPIAPARVAALIQPNPSQTTRARAAETTFASLPPEPAARAKPVASAAKPKPVKAAAAKPVTQEANAETAAPPAEPEPEHSEVFGLKVPSFAPAGRKIAEGVEALGNAVKNLPNQF